MMKPKVGLLPLYLKLYDDTMPEIRSAFSGMLNGIVARLTKFGIEVHRANVCRVRDEFAIAIAQFEESDVDLIVTVHLAYSPSLESAELLAATQLPLLMMDTTLDARFPQSVDPMRLMYNHGIHGVQDLASVLRRLGKKFEIVAGHCEDERLFERTSVHARGALAAKCLRTTKALRIGETFHGMGDFAVDDNLLREKLGISVDQIGIEPLENCCATISKASIAEEYERDCEQYEITASEDTHKRSISVGLGLRKLINDGGYNALSLNFLAFNDPDSLACTVPFLEASKGMARGIGYAGEGDVLTASLVGALQRAFGNTTFTEVFCPDWAARTLFISHMGEVNPQTAAKKPRLCEKEFPWTPVHNPAILACAPKPGPSVLVNIAPGPNDTFSLILAEMTVQPENELNCFEDWVRGWLTPSTAIEGFLEVYSRAGGTHHSALVLGSRLPELCAFASHSGLDYSIIR